MMRLHAVFTLATVVVATPLVAQDTGCHDTKFPPQLPPPSALVDSAHAIADLAAFAGPKPMVFSLVFGKGDSVPHIRALDKNDAAAALTLVNYVRHQPPADLWAIRVRVAGGDTPALTLERSQYCPPRPLSGTGQIQSVRVPVQPGRTLLRTGPDATIGKSASVDYEALIAVDGHVLVAHVLRSSNSGESNADVVRMIQQERFRPALLDGEPMAALFRSAGESPRP
jgi:hypothetical protein